VRSDAFNREDASFDFDADMELVVPAAMRSATSSRSRASDGGRRKARNMSISMAPLLIYSEQVPAEAREAIRAAYEAPPENRSARLESAARILHRETGLECGDVRELVGLRDVGD
jgi:hypothetical protein